MAELPGNFNLKSELESKVISSLRIRNVEDLPSLFLQPQSDLEQKQEMVRRIWSLAEVVNPPLGGKVNRTMRFVISPEVLIDWKIAPDKVTNQLKNQRGQVSTIIGIVSSPSYDVQWGPTFKHEIKEEYSETEAENTQFGTGPSSGTVPRIRELRVQETITLELTNLGTSDEKNFQPAFVNESKGYTGGVDYELHPEGTLEAVIKKTMKDGEEIMPGPYGEKRIIRNLSDVNPNTLNSTFAYLLEICRR